MIRIYLQHAVKATCERKFQRRFIFRIFFAIILVQVSMDYVVVVTHLSTQSNVQLEQIGRRNSEPVLTSTSSYSNLISAVGSRSLMTTTTTSNEHKISIDNTQTNTLGQILSTEPSETTKCISHIPSAKHRKMTWKDRYRELFFFGDDGRIHERQEALRGQNCTSSLSQPGYPFIPQSILTQCGLNKFGILAENSPALVPLNRSLGYIRPHKTGSTTIKGVVHRILYGRGMVDMVSSDKTYLGWPGAFSVDDVVGLENVLLHSKFDAFTHHSVLNLNRSSYFEYLRQPLSLFTILREPVSRTISAYHYFVNQEDRDDFTNWREFIDRYRSVTKIKQWKPAVFLNNLAFSLGWYHQSHINHLTHMDHNVTEINNFVKKLDDELDHVMILEHLTESLILWKHLTVPELSISELIWYDRNAEHKKKTYPTARERDELHEMLFLDRMIYQHFKTKLEQEWQKQTHLHPESVDMTKSLQCLQATIVTALEQEPEASVLDIASLTTGNQTKKRKLYLPQTLKEFMTLPAVQYTRMLRDRQLRRFGCDLSTICLE
jgi:hypothetical protein